MRVAVVWLNKNEEKSALQGKYIDCLNAADISFVNLVSKNFKGKSSKPGCISLEMSSVDDDKELAKFYDGLYEYQQKNAIDSLVIPVKSWKQIKRISDSNMQLTDKNILFCVEAVPPLEREAFVNFAKEIFKYRNIHISVVEGFACEKIYNLHFFAEEDIRDVLSLHINNRRKLIGWRYHANELRQKIKFHKDLLRVLLACKFSQKYKEKFSSEGTIPKVIHYCWFGSKQLPDSVRRFVENWQQKLPGYEIKLWNEDNFPIEKYYFAQEAYAQKKFAFVADVARLHALYYEGGIYLDTDVEILKDFDEFLAEDVFAPYGPMNHICMSTLGTKKHHPWIAQLLLWYDYVHCDEDYTEIANAKIVTKLTRMLYGIKTNGEHSYFSQGVHVYPQEYFLPKQMKQDYLLTDKTHCIHHFSGLW